MLKDNFLHCLPIRVFQKKLFHSKVMTEAIKSQGLEIKCLNLDKKLTDNTSIEALHVYDVSLTQTGRKRSSSLNLLGGFFFCKRKGFHDSDLAAMRRHAGPKL